MLDYAIKWPLGLAWGEPPAMDGRRPTASNDTRPFKAALTLLIHRTKDSLRTLSEDCPRVIQKLSADTFQAYKLGTCSRRRR